MTAPLADLASLLAPVAVEDFLRHHHEQRPLHVASDGSSAPLLTLDALCAAVPDGWREGAVEVFPAHFDEGRHTPAAIAGDRALLDAYLADGHPLVWNRARRRFPAVDALCASLGRFFGARVWPNVYVTGAAGTPFDMHFDAHEVFAVQCEGAKAWAVSSVRADRPTDDDPQPEVMAARREEARASITERYMAAPGDVVYLPRGLFHNAKAVAGTSLHVTFGVRGLTGHDVARVLAARALGDRELRGYAPPAGGDFEGWLAAVILRLGEHLLDEGLEDDVRAAREGIARGG